MSDPPDWTKEAVARALAFGGAGRSVTANVFLEKGDEPVEDAARRLLSAASDAAGARPEHQNVKKVRPLARAFSVEAEPRVLWELAKSTAVVSILPSTVEDIRPRPINLRKIG